MTVNHGEVLAHLVKVLDRALRALGKAGEREEASRLAAEAWFLLREYPLLERQLDGTLHALWAHRRKGRKAMDESLLDVRELAPARRHQLIFETFLNLSPGEAFILVNDHDPKPLYYQFAAEYPDAFTWHDLEEGPEVWRVRIGRREAGV